MANSVDPDLGQHCVPKPACLKTYDHYGKHCLSIFSYADKVICPIVMATHAGDIL